jgi:hypothetical protein
MTITVRPQLEKRLRARAEAEGLIVGAYVEPLVRAEQQAQDVDDQAYYLATQANPELGRSVYGRFA